MERRERAPESCPAWNATGAHTLSVWCVIAPSNRNASKLWVMSRTIHISRFLETFFGGTKPLENTAQVDGL